MLVSPGAKDLWRERLEEGRVAFNAGRYFEAHEHWEDVWHAPVGIERVRVQGLIQIAAGLHHLQGGRRGPAAGLLGKGLEKLSRGPGPLLGEMPVAALMVEVHRLLAQLAAPAAPLPGPIAIVL